MFQQESVQIFKVQFVKFNFKDQFYYKVLIRITL